VIDLGLVALVFGPIFLLELPDKTFVATLIMSTRYRPLAVWIGVGLAFGVQCAVAVTAGQAIGYLPDWVVHTVTLAIFLIGFGLVYAGHWVRSRRGRSSEAHPVTDMAR
jgi:putative Ca2+/H+ antiporter (TMEM165/GDT1 family)